MLSAILTLLGSSTVGSLLGGIFAFLNRKLDMAQKVQDQIHETKKWEHDLKVKDKELEYAQVEAASKKDVAFIEGEAVIESSRMRAISETSREDAVTAEELAAAGRWKPVLVFASAYRKSMRSVLTTIVGGAAIAVNLALAWQFQEAWPDLDKGQRSELILQALAWISAQASMMFGYWFVSRGSTEGKAK
jgi:hypothetical protein